MENEDKNEDKMMEDGGKEIEKGESQKVQEGLKLFRDNWDTIEGLRKHGHLREIERLGAQALIVCRSEGYKPTEFPDFTEKGMLSTVLSWASAQYLLRKFNKVPRYCNLFHSSPTGVLVDSSSLAQRMEKWMLAARYAINYLDVLTIIKMYYEWKLPSSPPADFASVDVEFSWRCHG